MNRHALQSIPSVGETLMAIAVDWWRGWHDRRELADLAELSPHEADRIAEDIHMTRAGLLDVAGRRPTGITLLKTRANHIGVDLDTLHPDLARDLVRCCALCQCKSRCAHDLKMHPDDAAWQSYCPNQPTFGTIQRR